MKKGVALVVHTGAVKQQRGAFTLYSHVPIAAQRDATDDNARCEAVFTARGVVRRRLVFLVFGQRLTLVGHHCKLTQRINASLAGRSSRRVHRRSHNLLLCPQPVGGVKQCSDPSVCMCVRALSSKRCILRLWLLRNM